MKSKKKEEGALVTSLRQEHKEAMRAGDQQRVAELSTRLKAAQLPMWR